MTSANAPSSTGTPHLVSDVMTHTVIAVGRTAPFKEIVKTLEQWKVSAVPVTDGAGRVVGVVSEADLLPKEEYRDTGLPLVFGLGMPGSEQRKRLHDAVKAGAVTAEQLMTAPAVTIHADATLPQAARAMAHRAVKRLPVVDGEGRLAGVVSRSDLLKVFLRPDEAIAEEIRREVADSLFAGTHPPVGVEVCTGVVVLSGEIGNTSLIPIAARLARAVEGVVDVDCRLTSR